MSIVCIGILVAACAPDPRPSQIDPQTKAPLDGLPTGTLPWPNERWWLRYQDPQLNRLMDLGVRNSPDLQEAQARYIAAERAVDIQRAQLNPEVRGLVDAAHAYSKVDIHAQQHLTDTFPEDLQISPKHSWSNSGLGAALFTWDLDLWGKQKDAVAQAIGQANAMKAEREMAANSLHYNIAKAYFDWQSLQQRLALAKASVQAASTYRSLSALRVHAGLDDPQTLDQADAQYAEQLHVQATVEGLSTLDVVQISALIGVSEQALGALQTLRTPLPDTDIPPYAGLELISRRPDIVATRWQIEASVKGIDSARAAYYPDVSLTGLGAFLRLYPNLGSGTAANVTAASIGPSISLPIFSGGRLKAQLESNQAQLDNAVASYNHAVVQAAQDVAEQVATMREIQSELTQQNRQVGDLDSQSHRADQRRQRGLDDDRAYLNLQVQLDQQRDARVQLDDQLMGANLGLIYALGGGYHQAQLPPMPDANTSAKDTAR